MIVTARHCVFDSFGTRISADALIFRLFGAPEVDILVTGHRATENFTEDQLGSTNDFDDYWYLTISQAPLPFNKSAKDFRAGVPPGSMILVVGVSLPPYIIDIGQDDRRWIEAVRFSRVWGAQRFELAHLPNAPPSKTAEDICIYHRSPTYGGMSGTALIGVERRAENDRIPLLYVAGLHLRSGGTHDWLDSNAQCGVFPDFNIGLVLPRHVLKRVRKGDNLSKAHEQN
ncbi:hypothetical protein ACETIH_28510 [Microvirga arabica]|uniref:Trypsin-like peptidase domain-containing protein n=1 Tax=Microvirga arabica TaxID=1128671 RepID=A0ABV6YH35_9HYPH